MAMPDMTPERMSEFVERLTEAQSALYGAIYTLLAGNAEVADVLQETNRVLWRKASTYDPTRPFLPWALAVARFEVLAHRIVLYRASGRIMLRLPELFNELDLFWIFVGMGLVPRE